MALLRNNLSLKMKGRAGAYTFYSSKGRQVARVSQNSSNYGESARRSLAQQTRRVKWANLVNFYKATKGVLHGAFESKRSNETDYNAFMRKNLGLASVALTRDAAATGGFIPQKFLLSEGSLPPVAFEWIEAGESPIAFLGFTAPPEESYHSGTIAAFTEDILANNPQLKEGMQISIIIALPGERSGQLTSYLEAIEITLSKTDTRSMATVLKGHALQSDEDENLILPGLSADCYFAVIISENVNGKLKVSTAAFAQGDTELEEKYSSEPFVADAIESYGLDPDRFLDSGDYQG